MATLDIIRQLKQQGYSDNDVISTLQDQGISPREINDALAQSKIKEAVTSTQEEEQSIPTEGMETSLISQTNEPSTQYQYTNQNQENEAYNVQMPAAPEEIPEGYGDQGIYPQPQPQEQYMDYQQNYGINAETMSEIAGQLITEKLTKTNNSISSLMEFKALTDSKVDKIDQRLQRIETIIDQLQTSLIRKSSEQVQDIEDIKTELKGMQTSFSKVINPLTDKARESKPIPKSPVKKSKK